MTNVVAKSWEPIIKHKYKKITVSKNLNMSTIRLEQVGGGDPSVSGSPTTLWCRVTLHLEMLQNQKRIHRWGNEKQEKCDFYAITIGSNFYIMFL